MVSSNADMVYYIYLESENCVLHVSKCSLYVLQ